MKIKALLFILVLSIPFTHISAQFYDSSMGIRFGTDMGITYKQRIAKRVTLEGIIQSSLLREEAIVTILGERHLPIITKRLNIYGGAGVHKGWINTTQNGEKIKNPIGVTAIAGIEFTVARINFSYDFKPAINLVGGEKRVYLQTAISVRYVLKKRKVINWDKVKRKRKKNKKKSINWRFWEKE